MNIELKLQLPSKALAAIGAADLATLHDGLDLPDHAEKSTLSYAFIDDEDDLLERLRGDGTSTRRVFVVVSSRLVDTDHTHRGASALATRILEHSWKERIIVGLIGVCPGADCQCPGLDCVIDERAIDRATLCAAVQKVSRRLWFKLPPARHQSTTTVAGALRVTQVTTIEHFRQSLALRHQVYSALGYVDARIANARIGLELDGYDPAAVHYVVTTNEQPDRIAGTMRIIVPGRRILPRLAYIRGVNYAKWCEDFANEEEDRVFRDLLNRPSMNALPILDSFDYFAEAGEQCQLREMIFPNHSCEVSRIVVHPDFRGCGILHLLMRKAITVASGMGKSYLLLECAPFHEHMYRKFGFQVVEDARRQRYYARAQRLDSWAVAMHRRLEQHEEAAPRRHRAPPSDCYELRIRDATHGRYRLSISCMDGLDVHDRLIAPYLAQAARQVPDNYMRKGTEPPLSSLLKLALESLDDDLDDVMEELFRRLPCARVKLVHDAGHELVITRAMCCTSGAQRSLQSWILNWLGESRVSA